MNKIFAKLFFTFLLLVTLVFTVISNCYAFYYVKLGKYPEVQSFIHNMEIKYHYNGKELAKLFNDMDPLVNMLGKIQQPYEEQPWYVYRNHLVDQDRIDAGLQYWSKHRQALQFAAKKYGVPPQIIVAIIGIESNYGQERFRYPVLNALATLAFTYPPRASFFRSELEQYLLLCKELHIDPRSVYGSNAGAIGLPQFMPSSYRKRAVSYCAVKNDSNNNVDNCSGKSDLFHDTNDVIVSVANFLQQSGWQRDETVAVRARVHGEKYEQLLDEGMKPNTTIAKFRKYGVRPRIALSRKIKAVLIELENAKSFEYWLGLNNFYALSHYNSSKHYVMAVYQLSKRLRTARYGYGH